MSHCIKVIICVQHIRNNYKHFILAFFISIIKITFYYYFAKVISIFYFSKELKGDVFAGGQVFFIAFFLQHHIHHTS